MFKIKISAVNSTYARRWCKKNFGPIPIKPLSKNQCINGMRNRYYDEENARWIHRIKRPSWFKFRNEDDAILFKLTWL